MEGASTKLTSQTMSEARDFTLKDERRQDDEILKLLLTVSLSRFVHRAGFDLSSARPCRSTTVPQSSGI